jgi:3-deoxy-D-manno-octulosonic acid hydroxylase-like protein
MTKLETFPGSAWQPHLEAAEQARAVEALEAGQILFFPALGFAIEPEERRFLADGWSAAAKNISYELARQALTNTRAEGEDAAGLARLMSRYARATQALVEAVIPSYRGRLEMARTSFRPIEIEGRPSSPRHDDTRLHIDAFPSRPTAGRRILRVFSNINPKGQVRLWRVGEPFESVARQFYERLPKPRPGSALVHAALGLTKGRRRAYDHYMLQLHDAMKRDDRYQSAGSFEEIRFPAGATWIVFTDQVPHAALAGRHALEQTFHLDPDRMKHPERSPLRVLEGLMGRRLV